jgi:hypothetical protein
MQHWFPVLDKFLVKNYVLAKEANMNKCPRCYEESEGPLFPFKFRHNEGETVPMCYTCRSAMGDQEDEDLAKLIVAKLSKQSNGGDVARMGKLLAQNLIREHRYLQGEIICMFYFMFREFARLTFGDPKGKTEFEQKGHGTDARNEAGANMVQKWSKVLD